MFFLPDNFQFFKKIILYINAFTHKYFYIENLLHTYTFTHRSLYRQKLWHTKGFPYRNFVQVNLFAFRSSFIQKPFFQEFSHKKYLHQSRNRRLYILLLPHERQSRPSGRYVRRSFRTKGGILRLPHEM